MGTKTFQGMFAGVALVAGATIGLAGPASASTPTSFTQNQQKLEQALNYRVSQLSRLTADVNSSTTLTAAHATTLKARLSTESADINALVAKVPGDTTPAELNADRQAMLRDNRVFAVETPQVLETIEADGIAAQVTSLTNNESSLQDAVNSLTGQPAFANAQRHYNAYVSALTSASNAVTRVTSAVMAQVPADFPGDTHVFVSANRALLAADVALAHATYDASIVGLASGGYTGS